MNIAVKIFGESGRVGQALLDVIDTSDDCISTSIEEANIAIDFSVPEALEAHLAQTMERRIPLVIGTTGFDERHWAMIEGAARVIPILSCANFSFGIPLLMRMLRELDGGRVSIVEKHRAGKRDAPSGTALTLSEALHGAPIESIREGDAFGQHTVKISYGDETVELKHEVHSRSAFAKGALRAARFLIEKTGAPRIYTFDEVMTCHV